MISYAANVNNLSSLLVGMKDYMFTARKVEDLAGSTEVGNETDNTKRALPLPKTTPSRSVLAPEKTEDILIPSEKDKLFWCFYIMREGLLKYHMLLARKFTEEKEYKIQLVGTLRDHKALLKKRKWKLPVIENELVNQETISIPTFLSLCAVSRLRIAFVKERRCHLTEGEASSTFVILMTEEGPGLLVAEDKTIQEKVTFYQDNYWLVASPFGRLRAVGSYRVKCLQTICHKLGLPIKTQGGKRVKKADLYLSIKELL